MTVGAYRAYAISVKNNYVYRKVLSTISHSRLSGRRFVTLTDGFNYVILHHHHHHNCHNTTMTIITVIITMWTCGNSNCLHRIVYQTTPLMLQKFKLDHASSRVLCAIRAGHYGEWRLRVFGRHKNYPENDDCAYSRKHDE